MSRGVGICVSPQPAREALVLSAGLVGGVTGVVAVNVRGDPLVGRIDYSAAGQILPDVCLSCRPLGRYGKWRGERECRSVPGTTLVGATTMAPSVPQQPWRSCVILQQSPAALRQISEALRCASPMLADRPVRPWTRTFQPPSRTKRRSGRYTRLAWFCQARAALKMRI